MTMFIIQSALLLAIAYILGCLFGALLRMLFGAETAAPPVAAAQGVAGGIAARAESQAPATPAPDPAPAPPEPEPEPARLAAPAPARTAAKKASTVKATARKPATRKPAAKKQAAPREPGKPKSIARPAKPDDLKMIAGIGPKIEGILQGLGIYKWSQIATWTAAEIEWVNGHLRFKGRIEREDWVNQAKALAKGGRDEYVRVFGKEPR